MDENDGEIEGPLKISDGAEESGHFCGAVLIAGMKSDEGIEEQDFGPDPLDGGGEGIPG